LDKDHLPGEAGRGVSFILHLVNSPLDGKNGLLVDWSIETFYVYIFIEEVI